MGPSEAVAVLTFDATGAGVLFSARTGVGLGREVSDVDVGEDGTVLPSLLVGDGHARLALRLLIGAVKAQRLPDGLLALSFRINRYRVAEQIRYTVRCQGNLKCRRLPQAPASRHGKGLARKNGMSPFDCLARCWFPLLWCCALCSEGRRHTRSNLWSGTHGTFARGVLVVAGSGGGNGKWRTGNSRDGPGTPHTGAKLYPCRLICLGFRDADTAIVVIIVGAYQLCTANHATVVRTNLVPVAGATEDCPTPAPRLETVRGRRSRRVRIVTSS